MNQEIKQLSEQIMNSVSGVAQTGEKLNQLTGWLVGYVAENQQIPAEQQLAILKKVREMQFDYLKFEYDRAYYRYVFCSESAKADAARLLKIWRHKYFAA